MKHFTIIAGTILVLDIRKNLSLFLPTLVFVCRKEEYGS